VPTFKCQCRQTQLLETRDRESKIISFFGRIFKKDLFHRFVLIHGDSYREKIFSDQNEKLKLRNE
jgi:hypothetical protein